MNRPCPLCGKTGPAALHLVARDTTFGLPGEFAVRRCDDCAMLYTNPQVAPSDLGAFYPPDYSAHHADRPRRHGDPRPGRDPWDVPPEGSSRRLLDVGCGSGAYLLRQQKRGWQAWGIDPSPSAVAVARSYGLNAVVGDLASARLPHDRYDLITMLGVLDHIGEPLAMLSRVHDLCDAAGRIIVSVPNAASAAAEAFGADWPGWDLPRHQNHFTPNTLRRMLERAAFRDVQLSWKRRASRWRRGARNRAASTGRWGWRVLAGSRRLCGLWARFRSVGQASDEIIAVARRG